MNRMSNGWKSFLIIFVMGSLGCATGKGVDQESARLPVASESHRNPAMAKEPSDSENEAGASTSDAKIHLLDTSIQELDDALQASLKLGIDLNSTRSKT